MAQITPQQVAEIKKLTRRANRRIERATGGQEAYLKSIVQRVTGGSSKFSAATKGLSFEQAAAKLEKLDRFLGTMSSTRKGWDWIRKEIVHKANQTLGQQGYDLTDEELAEILIQVDADNKREFYRAINLVTAKKVDIDKEELYPDEIAEAVAQKASFQQALKAALEANPEINSKVIRSRSKRK